MLVIFNVRVTVSPQKTVSTSGSTDKEGDGIGLLIIKVSSSGHFVESYATIAYIPSDTMT